MCNKICCPNTYPSETMNKYSVSHSKKSILTNFGSLVFVLVISKYRFICKIKVELLIKTDKLKQLKSNKMETVNTHKQSVE